MANPLISQGVLNRSKASVIFTAFPQLNVTAPYLGRAGVSMSFAGPANTSLPTMTGVVQSPELYRPISLRINLLKTQSLAAAFQAQEETSVLLGEAMVRPDVSATGGIKPYPLFNVAIEGVSDLDFSGQDAGYMVSLSGLYYVNNLLFTG